MLEKPPHRRLMLDFLVRLGVLWVCASHDVPPTCDWLSVGRWCGPLQSSTESPRTLFIFMGSSGEFCASVGFPRYGRGRVDVTGATTG